MIILQVLETSIKTFDELLQNIYEAVEGCLSGILNQNIKIL
jgi:predicted RNase H-like HicB family nuclease